MKVTCRIRRVSYPILLIVPLLLLFPLRNLLRRRRRRLPGFNFRVVRFEGGGTRQCHLERRVAGGVGPNGLQSVDNECSRVFMCGTEEQRPLLLFR